MTVADLSIDMEGDFVFRSPDSMYMTMEVMGESVEALMVLPDMYVRVPSEGWYVVTAESMGINSDVYREYVENRGAVDYRGITEQLDGLTQLPDETLEGVAYLHYEGTMDLAEAMEDVPEGLYDPEMLEQVEGVLQPVSVEVWLDRETYLPRRTDIEMTFDVEGSAFSMEMSMEFSGYNEPVTIPEPPADARPLDAGVATGL